MREIAFCTKWGSAASATACHCHCTHAAGCAKLRVCAVARVCMQASNVHVYLFCATVRLGVTQCRLHCFFASSLKILCEHATSPAQSGAGQMPSARRRNSVANRPRRLRCAERNASGKETQRLCWGAFDGRRGGWRARRTECHLRLKRLRSGAVPTNTSMLLDSHQDSCAHLSWALMQLHSCHKPRI